MLVLVVVVVVLAKAIRKEKLDMNRRRRNKEKDGQREGSRLKKLLVDMPIPTGSSRPVCGNDDNESLELKKKYETSFWERFDKMGSYG